MASERTHGGRSQFGDNGRSVGRPRTRVRFPVHLEQLRGVDVRVALRRAEARVAEQLLDRAQVRAALQQMRRERVPQRVRADADPRARTARRSAARDDRRCATVSRPPR